MRIETNHIITRDFQRKDAESIEWIGAFRPMPDPIAVVSNIVNNYII